MDSFFQTNKKNIMLINVWTGKLEQPDLRRMIKKCAYNYMTTTHEGPEIRNGREADVILIEEASGGLALIQDLRVTGLPIFGFNPRYHGLPNNAHMTNKADRARLASLLVEQKLVWLLADHRNPKYLSHAASRLMEAALSCPTGKSQDIVDSFSQAFIYVRKRHLLYLKGEEPIEPLDYSAFYDREID